MGTLAVANPTAGTLDIVGAVVIGTIVDGEFAEYEASGGTVTSVSVTTANGVSGSVATSTTTPAITLTLGAITPSSISLSAGPITVPSVDGTPILRFNSTDILRVANSFSALQLNGALILGAVLNNFDVYIQRSGTTLQLVGGKTTVSGPISIGSYTILTLPDAATYAGYYIDVSDAAAGAGLARSNGSAWKIPNTNVTIT